MYRAAKEAGTLGPARRHRPQSFEMSETAQIQAAMFQLLQQLIKVTARDKKYRPKGWPMPETAADIVGEEQAEQGYVDLMNEIVFLEQDEFDRHVAEHRAAQTVIKHEIEQ